MSDVRQPYFKIWAAESLLSDDLNSLSDTEERVFWRLSMVASLENERWFTKETPGLWRKCCVSEAKFRKSVAKLIALGMVERIGDDVLFVVSGPKWNEGTARKPAPSDSSEATRERKRAERERKSHEGVTTRDISSHDRNKEEEEDKEEEEEDVTLVTPAATAPAVLSEKDEPFSRLVRSWENATGTTVTRQVGDYLADWLERLPEEAIAKAITETGGNGAKAWKYTEAILQRYQRDGWADRPKGEVFVFADPRAVPVPGIAVPDMRFRE